METRAQSSAVAWLVDRLARLNPAAIDRPGVIESHADQIRGHWLSWRWRGDTYAIEIRGEQRPRAERVPVTVSTVKELRRLLRAANGTSDKVWKKNWLAVSSETHGLIFRPMVPPVIRREYNCEGKLVNFERADLAVNHSRVVVRGLEAIIPTRADARPPIEAALRKHEAASGTDRQKRQRDALADDVVRAVAIAYFDLTGKRGLFWDDLRGSHKGGLLDLGRDIEARFGGTGLFTIRRIKFIFETLKY